MKKVVSLTLTLTLAIPGLFTGCREISSSQEEALLFPPRQLAAESVEELRADFAELNYNWNELDQGVPSFTLERLPTDLHRLNQTSERKQVFFQALLPMILQVNAEIRLEQRELQHLSQLLSRGKSLSEDQQDQLQELAQRYKVKGDVLQKPELQAELLKRVQPLPTALVLAQAANESGYGTSRFARQANNLFGEWTFIPGTGLVPQGRPEGATYEVRRFPSILHSLRSYMLNLNSHRAYAELRRVRASLTASGKPVSGAALAEGLLHYSERGRDYIREIQAMIRSNRLERLAEVKLRRPDRLRRYGRPNQLAAAS